MIKPIKGYEDLYEITENGEVFSLNYNRTGMRHPLSVVADSSGYSQVGLTSGGVVSRKSVHRLVAEAFLPNPYNLPEVNHINEIKSDNNVNNLEWVSRQENVIHGTGSRRSAKTRSKAVEGTCFEGQVTYESLAAAKQGGFNPSHISACCKGKMRSHKGYTWKYI